MSRVRVQTLITSVKVPSTTSSVTVLTTTVVSEGREGPRGLCEESDILFPDSFFTTRSQVDAVRDHLIAHYTVSIKGGFTETLLGEVSTDLEEVELDDHHHGSDGDRL